MTLRALVLGFFRPAGLDFASMGSGLTGGLWGMQNASELPNANFNIPGSGNEADQMLVAAMRSMSQNASRNSGMVDPAIVQAYSNLLGIDLTPLIAAGKATGQQYTDLAGLLSGYGNTMQGAATDSFDAGKNTYMTSLDPQRALHDRMQQQVVDASRSGQSARGIAMSPYGAGIENKAVSDFNMDWQNQQLARQLAGLGGMDQAFASGANSLGGAYGYYGAVPGMTQAAASAPINAQQQAYGMPMSWADAFTQSQNQNVLGPQAAVMGQIYPYLGMAQHGQEAQYNAYMGHDLANNQMIQQSQYGLWGGGQSGTGSMQGNQSGAGNPMNWMGMMGGGGGGGGGAGLAT